MHAFRAVDSGLEIMVEDGEILELEILAGSVDSAALPVEIQ